VPTRKEYIFVLWGSRFEEAAAALFVTGLRQAGLLVKVVGLTPPPIRGANGLALYPDMMLGEALLLAAQAGGVIIPAGVEHIKPFQNDPRLKYFLYRASANQARLVVRGGNGADEAALELFPAIDNLVMYTAQEDLGAFTARLSGMLQGGF